MGHMITMVIFFILSDNGLKTRLEMIKNHAIAVLQELKVVIVSILLTICYLKLLFRPEILNDPNTEFLTTNSPMVHDMLSAFLYYFRARPNQLTKTWTIGWERGFYRR